jgi:hypothetical protein
MRKRRRRKEVNKSAEKMEELLIVMRQRTNDGPWTKEREESLSLN